MNRRWGLLVAALVAGYLFAEPVLETQLGVDLPGVHTPKQAATGTSTAGDTARRSGDGQATGRTPDRWDDAQPGLDLVLHKVGRDAYRSNAGLVFTRGSVHGHRLEHLLSHAKDEPNRPGQHGVFSETSLASLIELIDEVYLQALAGESTTKEREDRRVVYTVNLNRRVGYIGGESGRRRNHPSARHVRLILDGDRFITAYPVRP